MEETFPTIEQHTSTYVKGCTNSELFNNNDSNADRATRTSTFGHNHNDRIAAPHRLDHCHYGIIFGCLCQHLGVSLPMTSRVFLRNILRDTLSAASRLNIVGPMEASLVQASFQPVIEKLLLSGQQSTGASANASIIATNNDDVNPSCSGVTKTPTFYNNCAPAQTAPILELMQSRHDLLYTRLFNS